MEIDYKGKDGQLPLVIIGLGDDFRDVAKFGLDLLKCDFDKVIFVSDLNGDGHHTKMLTLAANDIDDDDPDKVDTVAYQLQFAANILE